MTGLLRYFLQIWAAAMIPVFVVCCTPIAIEDATHQAIAFEARLGTGELAILEFAPIGPAHAAADALDTDLHRIEARLFSIRLAETLAGLKKWKRVDFLFTPDRPDSLTLSGRIIESTVQRFVVKVVLEDNRHSTPVSRIYHSSAEDGPDRRFQDIADRLAADIAGPVGDTDHSAQPKDPGGRETAPSGEGFTELFASSAAIYRGIYYEDLIVPFSEMIHSGPDQAAPLIALEKETANRYLRGIGAVAEAIVRRCLPANSMSNTPLRALLEDRRLSRYSNFQPARRYAETIRQARALGLVIADRPADYTLAVGDDTYIFNGSAEEQIRAWHRMIVDICADGL